MATFDKQIDVFVGKAWTALEKTYRQILLQLLVDIVDGTPRDTGTLKNNWQFGTELTGKKEPSKNYPVGSEGLVIAKAAQKAQSIGTQDVFIFNNMEYARAIEEGLGPGQRTARRMVARAIELSKMKSSVGKV